MNRYSLADLLTQIQGGLIVSCQALPDEPLHGSDIMARMAMAAEIGGAVAIRANGPADVAAIRAVTELPIIGLHKVDVPGFDVYITPGIEDAEALVDAGADLIALDATERPHPEGTTAEFIAAVKEATGLPLIADISAIEEAISAERAGADIVSTTLSGYTPYSPQQQAPDLDLVRAAAASLKVPVLAEGRISTPDEARAALDAGAFAVVVGGAITRPQQITARFVRGMSK
jgi:N-acylglucosamine-6-phosphate 2-epimerase